MFISKNPRVLPVIGLLAIVGFASYMVIQLRGQDATLSGDFTNAATAEVRDAQGQIVLRGQFAPADPEDNEVERKATLEPVGTDTDARGEAEVEYATATPAEQEVEFSVRQLQPNTVFTFVIDGTTIATATTNGRGEAEVEVDVRSR